jgi:signal transduction histidine kinase
MSARDHTDAELRRLREELRLRELDVERLGRELEETNRGVLALYAELDEKALDLARVSELKSRFLSNISHELRTPLNSVRNICRLLLDRLDGPLSGEQERQVRLIQGAAESLSGIVSDLLDLARIEAGRTTIRPTEFSVADLFAALRGMFRPLVDADAVALVFDDASALPLLVTDEGKVAQILRNFIANAVKFTERGEVRVSAAATPDGCVRFAVSDTGIGIAPDDQARIFEEFSQVDHPLQTRVIGTGLGLPLSRKLAELLGGTLTLRSDVGVGSTFSATIPMRYVEPSLPPSQVLEVQRV